LLTKVSPFTENGRSPVDSMTAGGAPPRVPVNVWTLVPDAAAVLAVLAAADAVVAGALVAATAALAVVVAAVEVELEAETPRAWLKASAAAWVVPTAAEAAASAAVHAVLVASGALQEVESWPQMKDAITPMFNADPWLKSFLLAAMKAG